MSMQTLGCAKQFLDSSPRFRVIRPLGEGGMGVVYEAEDLERGERVAIKTLLRADPSSLQRLKHEFRALQDFEHPNLVRLGELHEEDGSWFITMELVPGTDLLSYVRGGAASSPENDNGDTQQQYDEGALRDVFRQLATGLRALHLAGKVHRDIKPSNVTVTPEGRVVILDFGLLIDRAMARMSVDGNIVGTVAYMAPEQAAAKDVDAAADWYAFGVVLYEALTGSLPFVGGNLQVMMAKVREVPDPPNWGVIGVPADLDVLCCELLRFDPKQRPRGEEVCARLGSNTASGPDARTISVQSETGLFLGRDRELAALRAAFDALQTGATLTMSVEAPSGTGKSSLFAHFVEQLTVLHPEVMVLQGRCYEREAARFKALDGIVDSLATELARLPRAERLALVPRNAALLTQLFPVLGRVDSIARAARPTVRPTDPAEERRWMFMSLRELFTKLGERRPLVLVIDDMQWADGDSIELLRVLLDARQERPPTLLLLTSARQPWIDLLSYGEAPEPWPTELRTLALGNLPKEDALLLTRTLLERHGESSVDAERLVRETKGHPLFMGELVRYVASLGTKPGRTLTLDGAIWARVEALPEAARQIVKTLAVAALPLTTRILELATQLAPSELHRELSVLRIQGFARAIGGRGASRIEPYHDRVREAVLAELSRDERVELHAILAPLLEQEPGIDHELVAQHYLEAGARDKAAAMFARAAQRAEEGFAFERAAVLYRVQLSLGAHTEAEQSSVHRRVGEALARAGQGAGAAEAFAKALPGAGTAEQLELRTLQAKHLLLSGQIPSGLAVLDSILASVGAHAPRSQVGAMVSYLTQSLTLWLSGLDTKVREEIEISPADLCRADALYAAAQALSVVDGVRAAPVIIKALRAALQVGERRRIVRSLTGHVMILAHSGSPYRRAVANGRAALADHVKHLPDDEALQAHVVLTDAVIAATRGEFKTHYDCAKRAYEMFGRQTNAHWERGFARLWVVFAQSHLGKCQELIAEATDAVAEADSRRDRWQASVFRLLMATTAKLYQGQPQEAARVIEDAYAPWRERAPGLLHAQWLLQTLFVHLAQQRWDLALVELEQARSALQDSQALRPDVMRILHGVFAASAQLQRFTATHDSSALRQATKHARVIASCHTTFASPFAALVLAQVAQAQGKLPEALRLAEQADKGFELVGMEGTGTVARWYRASLVGGDEGAALAASARAYLDRERILAPEAAYCVYAPYVINPPRPR